MLEYDEAEEAKLHGDPSQQSLHQFGIDPKALVASVNVARVPELSVSFPLKRGKVPGRVQRGVDCSAIFMNAVFWLFVVLHHRPPVSYRSSERFSLPAARIF